MSDIYVVVHIATTCDESTAYVARDSTELIELAWLVVDASTLENTHQETVLVRPINTPITPYCLQVHRISWEHVRNAGSFKDAVAKFDHFMQTHVILRNLDFSFVSLDVAKLRVQLPREARDKAVVLPPYLQHPRLFDLQNEYCKWQASHPEALSYTASSLSNILTALEVDVDASEDAHTPSSSSSTPPPATAASSVSSTSSNSFFSEPSGANLADVETKARPTINLHTKLLVQLVKKSQPVDDHPAVLTKPYDTAQDARIFLGERSKILYLSNLPSDTTQSELESWFTQYGGRPIAFWTLKSLDAADAKNPVVAAAKASKGIAGFAVFAKHEEAADSLSMNGRVLNDRAIEVQASSTRVLDKASDLLSPFPPSKNRPRPGDWTCPSCGFSNFQRRTACFRCSFPAASAVTIQESIYSNGDGNSAANNRRKTGQPNHQNANSDKIALNSAVVNAAAVFNSNYQYQPYSQTSSSTSSLHHSHTGHGTLNHGNHSHNNLRSHYGNNVPFRAGDWKCSNDSCQYHNFAKNLCCLKCGNAKPSNSGNHMNMASSQHHIHSVNSTAAAIAAATASGQPLNLSNSYMGLQQQQSNGGNNQHHNVQNSYSNMPHMQQQTHFLSQRGSVGGTSRPGSQFMPQNLAMLQQQTSQLPQGQQKYGQQGTNQTMYANYGYQNGYSNKSASYSGQNTGDSVLNVNPAFNALSSQLNSMNLNNGQ